MEECTRTQPPHLRSDASIFITVLIVTCWVAFHGQLPQSRSTESQTDSSRCNSLSIMISLQPDRSALATALYIRRVNNAAAGTAKSNDMHLPAKDRNTGIETQPCCSIGFICVNKYAALTSGTAKRRYFASTKRPKY
eukprot:Lithocolla_globosa_v1_NODE_2951_length_1817_cov_6.949403.p2 type:complete len:137 gc:universal NODE_2951_length_1817_cov_6.949403:1035-625(-)